MFDKFDKFKRWLRSLKVVRFLSGEFRCIRCGKVWYSEDMFGFGTMIGPECYNGENPWLWRDRSFWLNRLLDALDF